MNINIDINKSFNNYLTITCINKSQNIIFYNLWTC